MGHPHPPGTGAASLCTPPFTSKRSMPIRARESAAMPGHSKWGKTGLAVMSLDAISPVACSEQNEKASAE